MELSLLANAAAAMAALWATLRWQGSSSPSFGELWDAALTATAAGIFAGRIVAMLGDGVAPWQHPADVIVVRAGVSTIGAAITASLVFLVLGRRHPVAIADGVSAAALAGLAAWHGGCVLRGACLGTPSGLPWAVALPGSTITRHPVEIYAALAFAGCAAALAVLRRRGALPPGVGASAAVACAGAVMLLTEPMRLSLAGGPVGFYATAVVVGAATGTVAVLIDPASVRRKRAQP